MSAAEDRIEQRDIWLAELPSLTTLANKFGTDKGTIAGDRHAYSLVYETLFEVMRSSPIGLMEIGLCIGGPELGAHADREVVDAPSLHLWQEYFENARIYGVDISDFSRFQSERFVFYRADCGDARQLDRIAKTGLCLDIIIDDGSHASFHQQLTLTKLFPLLRSGGLYIIEDLGSQPPLYERSLPPTPKTVRQLSNFIVHGAFIETEAMSKSIGEIRNILMFDRDELATMRRVYNRTAGYLETRWPPRIATRGHMRRLLETGLAGCAAFAGAWPRRCAPVELAIIQKL
jgi:hypothetical protein